MIRQFIEADLPVVMRIWLTANREAHPFIDAAYWESHYAEVERAISEAEVYVSDDDGTVTGFIGLCGEYVAGVFVVSERRGEGIGAALLQYALARHHELTLRVYTRNTGACRFYIRQGFRITGEQTDEATGEREYVMTLRRGETVRRCHWCNLRNPLYVAYHDTVWGRPEHDDGRLFAMFLPETFQAGLSWECLLNKQEAFRQAFDGFDAHRIAQYGEDKVSALMLDKGIIRNRRKIEAAVVNARIFLDIQQECDTFDNYIWSFTHGQTVYESGVTRSALSDTIAADLRRRGMKFIGTTTVYAYLQAIGIVNAHEPDCYLKLRDK